MDPQFLVNRTDDVVEHKYICNESAEVPEQTFTTYLLCFLFVSLSLLITCGNLLVIISIIYFKQLHTPTNYLILSLAVADLLVGVVILPFSTLLSLHSCWYHRDLLCKMRNLFDILLCTCSIYNLCFISVDRYYAVCQPLTYRSKISVRVTLIMSVLSWMISILVGIGFIIHGLNQESTNQRCNSAVLQITNGPIMGPVFSFYIPAFIILTIYLKILIVAQRQARSIQTSTKCEAAVSKTEKKANKTLAIVIGVFLMCWTPYFLSTSFYQVSNYAIPVVAIETFKWLGWSNSMLNPFVYAFFYRWFRSAFRMIISGKMFHGDFSNSKLL